MARLPRLAVADHAHLVLLRGHASQPVFQDDADRAAFLSALHSACRAERVALHGYALLPDRVWLLCTPSGAHGLARTVQSLGRGFSAAFNRRHGRSGSVWDGRFRAAVVEGGAASLEAMVFVDQAPVRERLAGSAELASWSSARQHTGLEPASMLTDAAAYWALGNTPFDRCAAYRTMLDEPQSSQLIERLSAATHRGWAIGSSTFLDRILHMAERPVTPRPRGRPRKR
ncbi:MAG TPA: transposase [Burkholderiaceae bacterium]|nr:transposase [Burkholderiaceae bacterium]